MGGSLATHFSVLFFSVACLTQAMQRLLKLHTPRLATNGSASLKQKRVPNPA